MSEKVDVRALQEDALTPTERESFVRYVTKDNYRIFEGCSRMRNKRAWGGALIWSITPSDAAKFNPTAMQ